MKFKLTQREEDIVRSQSFNARQRRGFVGVVEFHNGPRGGRYRSIRTDVKPTLDGAVAAVESLAARRWKPSPKNTEIYEVNVFGEVVG